MNPSDDARWHEEDDDWISKSQVKREMHELKALGERLLELKPSDLDKVPLDDDLLDAVRLAHQLEGKRGAYKRQVQYLGKLLRSREDAPIREALERIEGRHAETQAHLHQLEHLREQLIEQGDGAINDVVAQYPAADRQRLRQLTRQAKKERDGGKPAKAFRELFKYLRELAD